MKNAHSAIYSFIILIVDSISLISAFVLAYIFRVSLDHSPIANKVNSATFLLILLCLLPFWLITFGLLGLYDEKTLKNRFIEFVKLLFGSIIGMLMFIGADFFLTRPLFPAKMVAVYGLFFSFLILLINRTLARAIKNLRLKSGKGLNNTIIIGDNNIAIDLFKQLYKNNKTGYKVLGIVSKNSKGLDCIPSNLFYTDFDNAVDVIKPQNIDTIIQTVIFKTKSANQKIIEFAQSYHIVLKIIPDSDEIFTNKIEVELFQNTPLLTIHQTSLYGWGRIEKRILDIVGGILLLIVTSPIMLLLYIIIKLTDKGPAIYVRNRMSRFSNSVPVYKFRSHIVKYSGLDPEEAFTKMGKPELIKKYRDNGDMLDDDPRVSKVGKFMRKYSLDELPQILNVIKGDLSLVGPRALIESEISKSEHKNNILSVKSGLTGLAVISGRRNISFEERRKLDNYYVQNWSFWLDIIILLKTVKAVFKGTGAK